MKRETKKRLGIIGGVAATSALSNSLIYGNKLPNWKDTFKTAPAFSLGIAAATGNPVTIGLFGVPTLALAYAARKNPKLLAAMATNAGIGAAAEIANEKIAGKIVPSLAAAATLGVAVAGGSKLLNVYKKHQEDKWTAKMIQEENEANELGMGPNNDEYKWQSKMRWQNKAKPGFNEFDDIMNSRLPHSEKLRVKNALPEGSLSIHDLPEGFVLPKMAAENVHFQVVAQKDLPLHEAIESYPENKDYTPLLGYSSILPILAYEAARPKTGPEILESNTQAVGNVLGNAAAGVAGYRFAKDHDPKQLLPLIPALGSLAMGPRQMLLGNALLRLGFFGTSYGLKRHMMNRKETLKDRARAISKKPMYLMQKIREI